MAIPFENNWDETQRKKQEIKKIIDKHMKKAYLEISKKYKISPDVSFNEKHIDDIAFNISNMIYRRNHPWS